MPELADIFEKYGSEYLKQFGNRMLPSHKKALFDIRECRTVAMGGHIQECNTCGHQEYVYHSCCNRSCPKCQGKSINKWLEQRKAELLPVTYFHMVFTIPNQLRYLVRSNQKKLLPILMKSVAYSLQKLAADPRYVGGKISILTVLHTWARIMVFHPHVHCLVPGGGFSFDNKYWIPTRRSYFLPVKALSKIFRGKFVEMTRKKLPEFKFPKSIWKKQWVVYSKSSFKDVDKIIEYLGRYVYKVAITNNRIISEKNGKITFKYKDSRDNCWKTMTLEAMEFIRRFLQHVPIKGFHRIRFYGLLSPSNRKCLRKIKCHLEITDKTKDSRVDKFRQYENVSITEEKNLHICPECSIGYMINIQIFPKRGFSLKGRAPP